MIEAVKEKKKKKQETIRLFSLLLETQFDQKYVFKTVNKQKKLVGVFKMHINV